MPNIIMKMGGGLGNQMFSYAFGRALSIKTGRPLLLDTSRYIFFKKPYRQFLLDKFNIAAVPTNILKNPSILSRQLNKVFKVPVSKAGYFNEMQLNDGNKLVKVDYPMPPKNRDMIYEGCWLSPKYFDEYRDILKKELTLKDTSKVFPDLIKEANKKTSVSIHFRRTDFVDLGWSGILIEKYYDAAMLYMQSLIPKARFFVFSDDTEWVKKNYSFGNNPVFCSTIGLKDYEELYLMSQCANHITSTSTFSWWGSYLSSQKGIITASAEREPTWLDKENIYPKEWVLI